MYQLLSSTRRPLVQTLWWSTLQGQITRCLSSNLTSTACMTESACNHGNRCDQTASHQPFFSQLAAIKKSSGVKCITAGKGKAHFAHQTWLLSNSDLDLEQSFTRLTLSPLELKLNTDLPVVLPDTENLHTAKVILDPSPFAQLLHDCPTRAPVVSFFDPVSNPCLEIYIPVNGNNAKKHASNIIQKRRRKMNRHQYLKWKKRNKFKLRIQKQRKQKKKRLKWEQHLAKFRFTGLKPGEGEEYLAKKKAKMAIFLRHLGIKTDEEEEAEKKKIHLGQVRKARKIIPEPSIPKDAKI
ncbi:uncharacterized protein LOC110984557 [Acanthaster planci]|uniref:Uncharacterized protein LOC110984557 n=1 Tax=Acanthaster planci TaxID=133434 RepID=A0A8B7Z6Y3_ACAPL|nr:uncharacterized protein LOC110984557 [Acanthaster planci]XP_022100551.1 uncharacterized protein LOC110984557 [Acanthaster planci]